MQTPAEASSAGTKMTAVLIALLLERRQRCFAGRLLIALELQRLRPGAAADEVRAAAHAAAAICVSGAFGRAAATSAGLLETG